MARPSELSNGIFDAASCDVYRRNGFRILGLPVSSTPSEIQKRKSGVERRLRAGLPAGVNRIGDYAVTEEVLVRAVERLSEPAFRLVDEMLWFWGNDVGSGNNQLAAAVDQFLCGNSYAAFDVWRKMIKQNSHAVVTAKHDAAVAAHILALEGSVEGLPPPDSILQTWAEVGATWAEFCAGGCVSAADYLEERVRAIADPRYSRQLARETADLLPVLVAATFAQQARQWSRYGFPSASKQLLDLLSKSPISADAKAMALRGIVAPLRREVEARTTVVHERGLTEPWECLQAALGLARDGKRLLAEMRLLLPQKDASVIAPGDDLAKALVMLQVRYCNIAKDWKLGQELLLIAKEFAGGEREQQHVDRELSTIRQLAKEQGLWRADERVLTEATEQVVLRAFAGAAKNEEWGAAITSIEESLLTTRMGVDESTMVAVDRVLGFMIACRGRAAAYRAADILSRATPFMERIRSRRKELREKGEVVALAATLAESLHDPNAPSICGCCLANVGGNRRSVAVFTIDGMRTLACNACKLAHAKSVIRDKKDAKPWLLRALNDVAFAREVFDDQALWADLMVYLKKETSDFSASVNLTELRKRRSRWLKGRLLELRPSGTGADSRDKSGCLLVLIALLVASVVLVLSSTKR
jgi:hypothetical protein